MHYNPAMHHRRSIRLQGYDYTQAGAYFITICTHKRTCHFGRVISGTMQLNAVGSLAAACWEAIPEHHQHVELDAFVVMPNHMHGILLFVADTDTESTPGPSPRFGKPIAGALSTVLRQYKAAVTRGAKELPVPLHTPIWQRNYYDHIIRSQVALDRIRAYIINNPRTWDKDQIHPNNPSKW